jgi:hypothetical protein
VTCAAAEPTWSKTSPGHATGSAKFLLRHGRPWRGGSTQTHAYQAWLRSQRFGPDPVSRRLSYVLGLLVVGVMLSVASYSTGLR